MHIIRHSREEDRNEIKALLYKCFGTMVVDEDAEKDIEHGRYLCYVLDEKIVSVSGIRFDDEYTAYQITWTCTDPEFRHHGYMQELFDRIIQSTDEALMCSCWRIGDADCVNLQTLMNMYGFQCVVPNERNRNIKYNCDRAKDCPYRTETCYCSNDLYIRPALYTEDNGK